MNLFYILFTRTSASKGESSRYYTVDAKFIGVTRQILMMKFSGSRTQPLTS
jgi:hypothetical protein